MASKSATRRRRPPAANVLRAMFSAHWAIEREKLEAMRATASRVSGAEIAALVAQYEERMAAVRVAAGVTTAPEALEAIPGRPLDGTWYGTVRDGVATIALHGPMFRYANLVTLFCGATSYEDAARDFAQALADSEVKAVILDIDSPGGEVNGTAEFAAMVRAARDAYAHGEPGSKPVDAYVGGVASSAAYWIASAARRIICQPTALLGSIGCIWGWEDTRKQDAANGVEHVELVSSQSPRKRLDHTIAEDRSELQAMLDEMADVFIDAVASNRGVSRETVLSDFGQGSLRVGASAVRAQLADAIGDFETLHAELAAGERAGSSTGPARVIAAGTTATAGAPEGRATTPSHTDVETAMATRNKQDPQGRRGGATPRAAGDGAATPETEERTPAAAADPTEEEQPDPANPAEEEEEEEESANPEQVNANANTNANANATSPEAIRAAERQRIREIRALGRPGEEAIVEACIEDGSTPAEAALRLRKAEGSAGATYLASLRADETNTPAPRAAQQGGEPSGVDAVVNSIVHAGRAKRADDGSAVPTTGTPNQRATR